MPVTYIRGGTSKALFFHEHHLPAPGPIRDQFLKRIMGSPDPMQIDGMGGSHIVTSKVAIIRPSDRSDADVDYTFAQVSIQSDDIGYGGNCGNISAGVGPFAIDEGLVKEVNEGSSIDSKVKTRQVRIYNTGTRTILISHVPIDVKTGKSLEAGTFAIAGVPGTGAPILIDFRHVSGPISARSRSLANVSSQVVAPRSGHKLLPLGQAVSTTSVGGGSVDFTLCHAANLLIFARARDLNLSGAETPASIDSDPKVIARVKELRGKAAQLAGLCQHWYNVDDESPMTPMVVLVSEATHRDAHIQSRLFLDNKCHTSMAGTGAIGTAACSRVPGSIVNQFMSSAGLEESVFSIQHPLGLMPISVGTDVIDPTRDGLPKFTNLSMIRTSRRILDGMLCTPSDLVETTEPEPTTRGHIHNGKAEAETSINGTDPDSPSHSGGNVTHPSKSDHTRDPTTSPTKDFARFVAATEPASLSDEVIGKLKDLLLDYVGVAVAATKSAESSTPFYNGIVSLLGSCSGQATVVGKGRAYPAAYAALLNGAMAHSLDFDDTHAGGALHPGASVVSAVLAEAETNLASPAAVFAALAVGYEITCRLGVALGVGGYQLGFHNTSTAGIFGAIGAIASLKGLSSTEIENAFGLAISRAAGSMQYLANGAWNKRLHPGFAAFDAFTCIALAEAGVLGASEPIEGRFGLLTSFTGNADLAGLTDALGSRWEFLSTAVKPFPGCRMTHGQIELADAMARGNRDRPVQQITVQMAPECLPIVGQAAPNRIHPCNIVDAQFSSYYQTAVACLYGSDLGWTAYDKLTDPRVQALCGKIRVEVEASYRGLQTSLRIRWQDGLDEYRKLVAPVGEADNPVVGPALERKVRGLVDPVFGPARGGQIVELVQNLERYRIQDLMGLLAE